MKTAASGNYSAMQTKDGRAIALEQSGALNTVSAVEGADPVPSLSGNSRRVTEPWLLVFDLDGTLIDSSLDLCLAVNAALQHVGAVPLAHELITSFVGDGASTLIRRALQHADPGTELSSFSFESRLPEALSHFLAFYREHKLDHTRLYPGVAKALHSLRLQRPQLLMAVLTNKPVRPAREICHGLGVSEFFFQIYGGDSFFTKKPEPLGLETLIHEAGALRQREAGAAVPCNLNGVVVLGDSDVDVQTARNAGVLCLGCRYGLAPAALEAAHPDCLCDTPAEWQQLLGL